MSMKKLFAIISLIALLTPVYAEKFFDLEWEEFAPNNFKNVKVDGFHWTAEGRYWANRRAMFEKRVAKCNSLSDTSQDACLKELRNIEMNANKMHEERTTSRAINSLLYSSF